METNAYLRDAWNWLDFIVVVRCRFQGETRAVLDEDFPWAKDQGLSEILDV